jgi:hypothetical protein
VAGEFMSAGSIPASIAPHSSESPRMWGKRCAVGG